MKPLSENEIERMIEQDEFPVLSTILGDCDISSQAATKAAALLIGHWQDCCLAGGSQISEVAKFATSDIGSLIGILERLKDAVVQKPELILPPGQE